MQAIGTPSVQTPAPTFKLTIECEAERFPAAHWSKALKSLASSGTRHAKSGLWRCVRGPSYQIWVSEAILHDRGGGATPPRWHIGVESLMEVDDDGRTKLQEVVAQVRRFLEDARLPFVMS